MANDAILKNVAIWHCKLDPEHPNAQYNKKNPTWELQIRTDDIEQKKQWESMHLRPKLMVGKEGQPNEGEPILNDAGKRQWRANLRRKSITAKGTPAKPVNVVRGDLTPIDPRTIGNGSIANLRLWQYEYENTEKQTKGIASIITAVQITKYRVYVPKAGAEFDMADTEVIEPEPEDEGSEVKKATTPAAATQATTATPTPGVTSPGITVPKDKRPESSF